jgi:uncharacterized protein YdeI (YjbR/CyaY-like superfamily)
MAQLKLLPDQFYAQTRAEWRAWLLENHDKSTGIKLVFDKKSSGSRSLSYNDQVEEALCFGWVDSKPGKFDEHHSILYFSPRKAKSGWSKPNKERIARLLEQGLMMPAGLAKIEAAKKDGSWEKLDAVEELEIPDDLKEALSEFSSATTNFAAFPKSAKRGILEWIVNAKKPETRAKRVEETARLAQENVRANQWQQWRVFAETG